MGRIRALLDLLGNRGEAAARCFRSPDRGPERVGTSVAWGYGFGLESAEIKWWTSVCPLFQEVDWLGEAVHCFGYAPPVGKRRMVV